MIYLLGGSGYVGQAYQSLLARKGIPFRNLRRADVDYTNPATLRDALLRDRPEFLINAAGYTGKPNVDACELHRAECLFGNGVFSRHRRLCLHRRRRPVGTRFLRLYLHRLPPRRHRFQRDRHT